MPGANFGLAKIELPFTAAADILAGSYDLEIGPETEIVPFQRKNPDLSMGQWAIIIGG